MRGERKIAIEAAREAGKIQMGRFGGDFTIRDKGKRGIRDLVTQADLESNRRIIYILKEAFPDYGIFSEETPEEASDSGCRWIIDPIDGTNNFAYGIPLFGTSIALEREGKLVLGVIYLPCFRELYVAERGRGAKLNGEDIHVSDRGIKETMVMFGGDVRNPDKRETAELMRRLEENTFMIRRPGAAIVHFAWLAGGRADLYVQLGNKPWDNAAGFVLVEEAGGRVTDFSGRECTAGNTQFVASNGKIHEGILRIINQ